MCNAVGMDNFHVNEGACDILPVENLKTRCACICKSRQFGHPSSKNWPWQNSHSQPQVLYISQNPFLYQVPVHPWTTNRGWKTLCTLVMISRHLAAKRGHGLPLWMKELEECSRYFTSNTGRIETDSSSVCTFWNLFCWACRIVVSISRKLLFTVIFLQNKGTAANTEDLHQSIIFHPKA